MRSTLVVASALLMLTATVAEARSFGRSGGGFRSSSFSRSTPSYRPAARPSYIAPAVKAKAVTPPAAKSVVAKPVTKTATRSVPARATYTAPAGQSYQRDSSGNWIMPFAFGMMLGHGGHSNTASAASTPAQSAPFSNVGNPNLECVKQDPADKNRCLELREKGAQ